MYTLATLRDLPPAPKVLHAFIDWAAGQAGNLPLAHAARGEAVKARDCARAAIAESADRPANLADLVSTALSVAHNAIDAEFLSRPYKDDQTDQRRAQAIEDRFNAKLNGLALDYEMARFLEDVGPQV